MSLRQVPFSIQLCAFSVLPLPVSSIVLFQDPFEIRGFVEDLAGKLCVGDNLSVAIVLQGTGADVEPFANLLACEEMFAAEEWPVRLGHFPDPFPNSS